MNPKSILGLTCPRCEGVIGAISCIADTIHAEGEQYAPLPHTGKESCVACGTPPGGLHHVACNLQRCPRCGELLMAGCRCERSREIHTQLSWFARVGNLDAVKLLILDGVLVDFRDEYGRTALHEAVGWDEFETTQFLLQAGADPNLEFKTTSIIEQAATRGAAKFVELLLDNGAALDGGVLHATVGSNDTSLVEFLLARGASIEQRSLNGGTPLMFAAGWCMPDMVNFLLARGANIHAVDAQGRGVLEWAQEDDGEYPEESALVVKILLKWGARPGADVSS